MSTLAWRRLLLTLCAFAFVQLGVNVWMEELHFGSLPGFAVPFFGPAADADSVQRIPTARAGVEKLIFPATNALAQTGLRSGDLLDLRAVSAPERYRWATGFWRPGEQFRATINRIATDRDDLLAASLRRELDALRLEMTELRARPNVLP
jgi:hypothetical protein